MIVSRIRFLIYEKRVNPGDYYVVEDYGNLCTAQQSQLACKYFNGWKIIETVYWYAPNNFMVNDSCPFSTFRN